MTDTYPRHLAGRRAAPPAQPTAAEIAAAKATAAAAAEDLQTPLLRAARPWRPAGSLVVLGDESNTANPARDRSSDGLLGNTAHAANWTGSDHNPFVVVDALGVVRARDIDTDGLDLATAFEKCRAYAAAGWLPQLLDGGYLILNRRITSEDFSGWRQYSGPNPHTGHGHVSVSRDPARFDDRRPWLIFTDNPWPGEDPAPAPAPPAPGVPASGRDASGRGQSFRAAVGDTGPRVGQLQSFLNRAFPAYSRLALDGVYGPATAAVVREFARRSGIGDADGLNVGPRLAAALWRAGFDRSAGTQRALRHLARADSR